MSRKMTKEELDEIKKCVSTGRKPDPVYLHHMVQHVEYLEEELRIAKQDLYSEEEREYMEHQSFGGCDATPSQVGGADVTPAYVLPKRIVKHHWDEGSE